MKRFWPDWLYFGALAILAAGMPHANLFMSIGTILLLLVWLGSGRYGEKFRRLRKNLPALLVIILYGVHVVWLFNTSDFEYALKDLRVKLPLLVIPLVLGSVPISRTAISRIFAIFWISCTVAILRVIITYLQDPAAGTADPRSLVDGISHIRLSLMVVLMVIYVCLRFFSMRAAARIGAVLSVAGAFIFIHLLQSVTGIAILFFVAVVLVMAHLAMKRKFFASLGIGILLLILLGLSARQVAGLYHSYFTTTETIADLPAYTAAGHPYTHYTTQLQVENGHYVWMKISYEELATAWNKRSSIPIDPDAPQADKLESTLIRYLTSKGLPKDKSGVEALTNPDIEAIEKGIPSVAYRDNEGLKLRLHKVLFDLHMYQVYGDPSGNSVSQRLAYWQTGADIYRSHWLAGVGTGDVPDAFNEMYQKNNTRLKPQFWRRTHNQFLTFMISFGIAGLYFFAVLLLPFRFKPFRSSLLWIAFIAIAFLSCLTEDTLETQAGVTFFAFFYMLIANLLWFQPQISRPELLTKAS